MSDSVHTRDSFVFKTDRPWPNPPLEVAAIVGHATPASVRLWLRTGRTGEFSLLLYPEAGIGDAAARRELRERLARVPLTVQEAQELLPGATRTDFTIANLDSDTTTVLDLADLDPDTHYGYVLHARGAGRVFLGHNRSRGFRTPPAYDERRPFQFALFSCHMPYKTSGLFQKRTEVRNLEMWDFLGASLRRHGAGIDLVIAGGDQCYTDGVRTLDIWRFLNRRMREEGGTLLPDEDSMLSWYRDIYRGYWGFPSVQEVFDSFPTYMIWDDHEIGDGWGSYYAREDGAGDAVRRMLPELKKKGLDHDAGCRLVERMFRAARRAYVEYEHSHNPPTEKGVFDYSFRRGGCAYYVLDGRGRRDVNREGFRVLGRAQFQRFKNWIEKLDPEKTKFLFVVSAVPVLHTRAGLVNADENWLTEHAGLDDDLRDSWEHEIHNEERRALLDLLFEAAAKGIRVSVLSGDVHVSAVFSIRDQEGRRIYQLTSSAITYGLSRAVSWVLSQGAADEGETADGHEFQRLALYADGSYALISVDPRTGEAWFKLYGKQKLDPPRSWEPADAVPLNHSVAKIRLFGAEDPDRETSEGGS